MRILIHFGSKSNSYGVTPEEAGKILNDMTQARHEYVYPRSDSVAELADLVRDVDVIIGTSATLDAKAAKPLREAKRLRLIQSVGTGVESFPLDSIRSRHVYLANISGANAVAVAEHAFALMLAVAKRICEKNAELKNGVFARGVPLVQFEGKTLAVVGLGAIGRELAKRALAFEMRVVAVKRHPKNSAGFPASEVAGVDRLSGLLKQAEFVVVTVPLTQETRGMIGEAELRSMKPTVILVNVGRGQVIDESALFRALTEGWIAKAGIDAWYAYPPDPQTPSPVGIHKLPNVVATPLIGSTTPESISRIFKIVA